MIIFMMQYGRKILSNIVASQIETHRLYGGVVPEIASRAHIEAITRVTERALDEAGITIDEVGAIAVTAFPGLIGALLVGVNFAKSLAFARKIPLVAVIGPTASGKTSLAIALVGCWDTLSQPRNLRLHSNFAGIAGQ